LKSSQTQLFLAWEYLLNCREKLIGNLNLNQFPNRQHSSPHYQDRYYMRPSVDGPMNLLLERPTRDIDDVAVVHVPAAFPLQVRNDPVGDVVHVLALTAVRMAQLPFRH
jgi:hypothetical protein